MAGAEVAERCRGLTGQGLVSEAPRGLVASVRRHLVRAVLERRFDTRLPTIDDLGVRLGVSRTTVRAAIRELERDGLVSRRRAVGTLVNKHVGPGVLFFHRLLEIQDLLVLAGHAPERIPGWDVPLSDRLLQELAGVSVADIVGATRRYVVGSSVVVTETDLLRRRDARRAEPDAEAPRTLAELIGLCSARRVENSVIELHPKVREAGVPCSLGIPKGQPYLRVVERHFDLAGEAVAWTVVDIDVTALPVQTFRTQQEQ